MLGFVVVIGALARLIKLCKQNLGRIDTLVLGLAGSVIGGLTVDLFRTGDIVELNVIGFIVAVIAVVFLVGTGRTMTARNHQRA